MTSHETLAVVAALLLADGSRSTKGAVALARELLDEIARAEPELGAAQARRRMAQAQRELGEAEAAERIANALERIAPPEPGSRYSHTPRGRALAERMRCRS